MHTQEKLVYFRTSKGQKIAFTRISPREIAMFTVNYDSEINKIIEYLQAGKYLQSSRNYYDKLRKIGLLEWENLSNFGFRYTYQVEGEGPFKAIMTPNAIIIRDKNEGIPVLDETIEYRLKAEHQLILKSHGIIQSVKTYFWEKLKEKTIEEPFKKAKVINWEILPPGWWNDKKYIFNIESDTPESTLKSNIIERLKFIDSLSPHEWFQGKNYLGRRSYYVAVFQSCVIAESSQYGNAAYVVYDTSKWQSVLNRTKRQVLQFSPGIVSRVPHTLNANNKLAKIVQNSHLLNKRFIKSLNK
jgi:hypothetical protein